eukprot:TRINITY_DN68035_c0_g1_i1.p1 TRINITY_DN68035_c0_g1~~TRINITY_DN68035_c0_g1_i1.p1  ORF type:complete len:205 (+),score=-7.53 TRINITY_DN68035_c0_g1_i1:91-705(+)
MLTTVHLNKSLMYTQFQISHTDSPRQRRQLQQNIEFSSTITKVQAQNASQNDAILLLNPNSNLSTYQQLPTYQRNHRTKSKKQLKPKTITTNIPICVLKHTIHKHILCSQYLYKSISQYPPVKQNIDRLSLHYVKNEMEKYALVIFNKKQGRYGGEGILTYLFQQKEIQGEYCKKKCIGQKKFFGIFKIRLSTCQSQEEKDSFK